MRLMKHRFVGIIKIMDGLPMSRASIDLYDLLIDSEKSKLDMVLVWMIVQSLFMGLLEGRYALL